MKLNLRQIEVFRAIMLSGSISGASKLLFVSQPAVSRLIAYTEQRLGLMLFERIKGRLYPTPEAKRLFAEVSTLYQIVQRVNEVADNLAENRVGQLRLSCSPSLGQSLMPRAIAAFRREFPEVRLVLQTLIPSVMLQSLLTQQVELGVAYLSMDHPSFASQSLYENHFVAVLPEGHPLAGRAQVSAAELAEQPLIGYSADIPFAMLVRDIFAGLPAEPEARIEVQQAHVACAMVQAGAGVALVDEMSVRGPIWSGVVTVPVAETVSAPISVYHLELEPLSRLAREFIRVLRELET
ncbi:LysR family transcriptional regulator [Bordetella trematum]|uniref:LysR family transcriptional regulator n=1 Tax=Bordetella trematum TaxID=123899 RepID=A0A157NRR2_9BORD|nr:LysR family transcriptional regulator [Bordetella trematum]AUL46413.1 LysR family transcriptional regulator [Bordetella trematum]AZR93184.1 LysR family transcriptional regulator [Bordetella trematum]NNH21122.1 LysR family transcriptional regulator [Bordetella trematum]QIM71789.1 LysR family transcriptional regulator [Bordetella trematum]SAI23992.1 LysR family transcriptional regulator [Bordetella trematum]